MTPEPEDAGEMILQKDDLSQEEVDILEQFEQSNASPLGSGFSRDEIAELDHLTDALQNNRIDLLMASQQGQLGKEGTDRATQQALENMEKKIVTLSRLLVKLDSKVKSMYKIIEFSHKKSEMLNGRIDDLIEMLASDK